MPPYSLVTVTVYTVSLSPFVTVMVSVFSPMLHVGLDAFSISVSPSRISTAAFSSAGVAVTLLVLFDVETAYAVVSGSNVGVRESAPIVRADRLLSAVIPPR